MVAFFNELKERSYQHYFFVMAPLVLIEKL
jgi:hypothetical protein